MNDPRDYKLDISSLPKSDDAPRPPVINRPYLSVLFECCSVYQRVYRAADGKTYRGACPKCGLPVNFAVGEGGTSARIFKVR